MPLYAEAVVLPGSAPWEAEVPSLQLRRALSQGSLPPSSSRFLHPIVRSSSVGSVDEFCPLEEGAHTSSSDEDEEDQKEEIALGSKHAEEEEEPSTASQLEESSEQQQEADWLSDPLIQEELLVWKNSQRNVELLWRFGGSLTGDTIEEEEEAKECGALQRPDLSAGSSGYGSASESEAIPASLAPERSSSSGIDEGVPLHRWLEISDRPALPLERKESEEQVDPEEPQHLSMAQLVRAASAPTGHASTPKEAQRSTALDPIAASNDSIDSWDQGSGEGVSADLMPLPSSRPNLRAYMHAPPSVGLSRQSSLPIDLQEIQVSPELDAQLSYRLHTRSRSPSPTFSPQSKPRPLDIQRAASATSETSGETASVIAHSIHSPALSTHRDRDNADVNGLPPGEEEASSDDEVLENDAPRGLGTGPMPDSPGFEHQTSVLNAIWGDDIFRGSGPSASSEAETGHAEATEATEATDTTLGIGYNRRRSAVDPITPAAEASSEPPSGPPSLSRWLGDSDDGPERGVHSPATPISGSNFSGFEDDHVMLLHRQGSDASLYDDDDTLLSDTPLGDEENSPPSHPRPAAVHAAVEREAPSLPQPAERPPRRMSQLNRVREDLSGMKPLSPSAYLGAGPSSPGLGMGVYGFPRGGPRPGTLNAPLSDPSMPSIPPLPQLSRSMRSITTPHEAALPPGGSTAGFGDSAWSTESGGTMPFDELPPGPPGGPPLQLASSSDELANPFIASTSSTLPEHHSHFLPPPPMRLVRQQSIHSSFHSLPRPSSGDGGLLGSASATPVLQRNDSSSPQPPPAQDSFQWGRGSPQRSSAASLQQQTKVSYGEGSERSEQKPVRAFEVRQPGGLGFRVEGSSHSDLTSQLQHLGLSPPSNSSAGRSQFNASIIVPCASNNSDGSTDVLLPEQDTPRSPYPNGHGSFHQHNTEAKQRDEGADDTSQSAGARTYDTTDPRTQGRRQYRSLPYTALFTPLQQTQRAAAGDVPASQAKAYSRRDRDMPSPGYSEDEGEETGPARARPTSRSTGAMSSPSAPSLPSTADALPPLGPSLSREQSQTSATSGRSSRRSSLGRERTLQQVPLCPLLPQHQPLEHPRRPSLSTQGPSSWWHTVILQ